MRAAAWVAALVLGLCACRDAPPSGSPLPASYVEWRSASERVERPLAVFVGPVGGPMDRLARDLDVTTFLNDRFHPLLLPAFGDQPEGTTAIYSADGCLLWGPASPAPDAWIAHANEALRHPRASQRTAPHAAVGGCP